MALATTPVLDRRFQRIAADVGVTPEQVREIWEHLQRIEARRGELRLVTRDLLRRGYIAGALAGPVADAVSVDRQACREATCAQCGHEGLGYRPLINLATRSYRAFFVCPACGEWDEF